MRALDEQAFDTGYGTQQYQDGNTLNGQNQLQGYFNADGVSTYIGGGGKAQIKN